MDVENIKKEIQVLIDDALARKDFAGIGKDIENTLKKAEDALNDMIARLTDSEAKATEAAQTIEALKNDKDAASAEVASLKEELDKVNNEKSGIAARLAEIEGTLRDIEENKRLETRVVELSSLKIARTGDAFDSQKNLVKKMSDEEFASYRDELVALRADLMKTVETAATVNDGSAAAPAPAEGDVSIPPPAVNKENAAIVAPVSTNDVKDRIKEFGDAFAKYSKERNEKAPKSK